jgi:hypothetical protein
MLGCCFNPSSCVDAFCQPIMIAESTPFGGIHLSRNVTGLAEEMDTWETWFGKVLSLIDRFDISMWSYINCNWEAVS